MWGINGDMIEKCEKEDGQEAVRTREWKALQRTKGARGDWDDRLGT